MEHAYKLLNLLATAQPANVELSYQLLQPYLGRATLTELYLIHLVSDRVALREDVRSWWLKFLPAYFSRSTNYFFNRSYWELEYYLQTEFYELVEVKLLDIKKILYFFERLSTFQEMHSSVKRLFMIYGSTDQVKRLIYAFKTKNTLNLSTFNLTQLPALVLDMKGLEKLDLSFNALTYLPDDFFERLPSLTTLLLRNNQFHTLPPDIERAKKLHRLDLSINQFKRLPVGVERLKHLKFLDISSNHLEELPDSLAACTKLEQLCLRGNNLTTFPTLIIRLKLKKITGIKGFDQPKTSKVLVAFIETLQTSSLSLTARENLFHLFVNNQAVIKKKLSIKDLIGGLAFPNAIVQSRAIGYLLDWPTRALSDYPLQEGDEVFLLGDTQLKAKTIQSRLQKKGVRYTDQLQASTTHVVLGANPKNYELVEVHPFTFLTEQDVNQFLKQKETSYLLLKEEDAFLNEAHVKELLVSTNENRVELGIKLLKRGGVSRALMTELLFVAKTVDNTQIRAQAKRLLKTNGSASIQKATTARSELVSDAHDAEEKVFESLVELSKLSSEINWPLMGWYLYRNFGNGLRYIFGYEPPESPLRQAIISSLIQDNTLNFLDAYANYTPSYNLHTYGGQERAAFPVEILHHPNLVELDCSSCHIAALPVAIADLVNLEYLYLSSNLLTALPDTFQQLRYLKRLDLSDNEFAKFPSVLLQMPWLKQINLQANRQGLESSPLTLSAGDRGMLPDTELIGIS